VDGRSRASARLLRVIRDLLTAHPSIAVYPDKRTISEPYNRDPVQMPSALW
jgi:hypothetical protein